MGRSITISYCELCGRAIGRRNMVRPRPDTPFQSIGRGLTEDGRWTAVGTDSGTCSLTPARPQLQRATDLSGDRRDPDLVPSSCWHGMTGVDRERRVVFKAIELVWICAKWLDTYFHEQSIRLICLASYLFATNKEFSHQWSGDHLNCPDDGNIQSSQGRFVKRRQFFVLARPDSLWWTEENFDSDYDSDDPDLDDDDDDPDFADNERAYDGSAASCRRLRRGTYEGAAELVQLPTVSHPTLHRATDAAAAASNTSLSFAPDRLPHVLVATVLAHLPVDRTTTGAIALLSSSRTWFHFGRSTAWRYFCRRDGFARVPTRSVAESLAEYESRGVDWKRVYFCYESRNARRIARNLGFLAERARRVQTQGVDEGWVVAGRNPLVERGSCCV
ncbi:hypothetical protein DFJ73DRAFT_958788 [Zopfochytrium polystomum]|nr:hypothetical protein DFJ73DRAFT_958788 [Zopfochytrium polystomum]